VRGYNVSETHIGGDACEKVGTDKLGVSEVYTIYRNLSYPELFKHEVANMEGVVAKAKYGDTFAVDTGVFTGRSPSDKWTVANPGSDSEKNFWWGPVNRKMKPKLFDRLYKRAVAYFNTLEHMYVCDVYCGANPKSRIKVRFLHELAWQQHFVTNMFIRPETKEELQNWDADFTVINSCALTHNSWKAHGMNSDVNIAFNVEKRCAVIFGTWYGGENKKGIFALMNYLLPMRGIMTMHCSANVGKCGDTALFFGLSGTGKTTLSADPKRFLIGDDEHGWDEDGIFNLEGGCYAKTIDLSEKNEPEIFRAIRTDALLENCTMKQDGSPDFYDTSKTQNGRVSYPIFHIPSYHKPQMAGHPKSVIFLTCDAFGVLPPISKLSNSQAMYHFLSGYTAKVAGTERGVTEPTATFSACFGAAFLTLHPTRYADLLQKKFQEHGSTAYLVNTGWSGGAYGVGERMSINATRACIDAILSGDINKAKFFKDHVFGFDIPCSLPGVSSGVLNPREAWDDKDAYDDTRIKLAKLYIANFEQYAGEGEVDYSSFGPVL